MRASSKSLSNGADRRYLALDALEAFVKKVEKLRSEGLSIRTVAERLGVGSSTICDRMSRWKSYRAAQEEKS